MLLFKLVKIEFEDLNIDPSLDCAEDSISLYDGPSPEGMKLDTLCGEMSLFGSPYISSGDSLTLTFTSGNTSSQGTGFKAVYYAITHGNRGRVLTCK